MPGYTSEGAYNIIPTQPSVGKHTCMLTHTRAAHTLVHTQAHTCAHTHKHTLTVPANIQVCQVRQLSNLWSQSFQIIVERFQLLHIPQVVEGLQGQTDGWTDRQKIDKADIELWAAYNTPSGQKFKLLAITNQ